MTTATHNLIAYVLRILLVLALLFWVSGVLADAVGHNLITRIGELMTNAR